MKCPYCFDDESEEYLSETDLQLHILKNHPDKTMNPENLGKAMKAALESQRFADLAGTLTLASLQYGKTPDEVLTIYREFMRKLMGSPV